MLNRLIQALKNLPGVGEKTAARYAYALLNMDEDKALEISSAVEDIKLKISYCSFCNNLTNGSELCTICSDPNRDGHKVLVVEDISILQTIERTGEYRGRYYIVSGDLSLLYALGDVEQKPMFDFLEKVKSRNIKEVIVATNPTIEGDAVGVYLADQLMSTGVSVTRIAYGIPVGVDLGYIDDSTLIKSLEGRREVQ